jgi:hypothetical protein
MKFITLAVTALGLSLLTAHSYAEQTGYEVELIIYEDATKRYIDSEDWSYNDMLNQTNDAVLNEETLEPDAEFSELDWDGAVLSDALKKIQDSPGFNVLLTKRWRQTGLDRDMAYSVMIGDEIESLATDKAGENTLDDTSSLNRLNQETPPVAVMPHPATWVNGYARLVMSRYLHFEVNLNYHKLQQITDSNEPDINVFPVVAERRMRSREVHYIDHPLVGIIVHATPYTINNTPQKIGQ